VISILERLLGRDVAKVATDFYRGVPKWVVVWREEVSQLRVPPALLVAGLATGQHLIARHRAVRPASAVVAAVVSLASGWLLAGSVQEFRRQRTSVNPVDVAGARSLVIRGPNRLTRNPMYVGMAGLLIANAILRRSAVAVLPAAAFVLAIDRSQIRVEEDALAAEFGDEFERYCRSVPRWLDRRSVTWSTPSTNTSRRPVQYVQSSRTT
jgi:protein-S-isoprenylcysteine O-methyltransferase Ste14